MRDGRRRDHIVQKRFDSDREHWMACVSCGQMSQSGCHPAFPHLGSFWLVLYLCKQSRKYLKKQQILSKSPVHVEQPEAQRGLIENSKHQLPSAESGRGVYFEVNGREIS